MSTIEVSPAALEQCAEAIGTTGDSLSTVYLNPVYDYIDGMAIEDTGSVVFSNVYDYNSQVMSRLRTDTVRISGLLVSSGSALSSSADVYRAMDEAARERYDGQYRAGGSVALDPRVPTGATPAAPASALAPPEAGAGAGYDLIDRVISWTDWSSISGAALKLAGLFGLHPMDQLTAAIFGDYDSGVHGDGGPEARESRGGHSSAGPAGESGGLRARRSAGAHRRRARRPSRLGLTTRSAAGGQPHGDLERDDPPNRGVKLLRERGVLGCLGREGGGHRRGRR